MEKRCMSLISVIAHAKEPFESLFVKNGPFSVSEKCTLDCFGVVLKSKQNGKWYLCFLFKVRKATNMASFVSELS